MRHHEIEPVGPPRHGGAYAVAPGWSPSPRPPAMCRLGFLVSLLWWRTVGVNRGEITTTTRRAMRVDGRRRGANGRMLFLLAPTSRIEVEEVAALRARALALAADLSVGALMEREPADPLVLKMPDGGRLVTPGEVWGTWPAWCHVPNREEAGR